MSDAIEKVVEDQRKWCGKDFLLVKDYYKSVLKTIVWIIGITGLLFTGVIAWSYQPIEDIATLKVEIRVINSKPDQIIKQNGGRDGEK